MTSLAGRVFALGDVVYRFTEDRLTDVVTASFSGGDVVAGSVVGVRDGRRVDGVSCSLLRSGLDSSGPWSCVVGESSLTVGVLVLEEVPGPPYVRSRVARPVRSLSASLEFYCTTLGLAHTGGFQDHDGYDGAFVALPGGGELELTTGSVLPTAPDDLLVLYLASSAAARALADGLPVAEAENPYWREYGVTVVDPDGYRVVLTSPPGA